MKKKAIGRGEIWWVSLDPTEGSEIKKTRPCLVLTHDTLNELRRTVVVIPLSTAAQSNPPITVPIDCAGKKSVAVIDQIRAVTKHRLQSKLGEASVDDLSKIEDAVKTVLQLA
ncbi:MAG: type II toxin-antitoxin system PemK/MazF family toxin [Opitutales bacterium]